MKKSKKAPDKPFGFDLRLLIFIIPPGAWARGTIMAYAFKAVPRCFSLCSGLLLFRSRFAWLANFKCHLKVYTVHNNFALIDNGGHVIDIGRAQIAYSF